MELGPVLLILLGQLIGILPQRCWRGPPSYLCPSAPTSLEVYLRHETYCSRFYKCIEGEAVEGICPLQEYFDPLSNTCLADESLCSRSKPRSVDVPGCEFCQQIFVPSERADQFFVCRYDGFGRAERCPRAVDLCTKVNVSLTFVDGRCEPERLVETPFRIASAAGTITSAPLGLVTAALDETTEMITEVVTLESTLGLVGSPSTPLEQVTDRITEGTVTETTGTTSVTTTTTTEEPLETTTTTEEPLETTPQPELESTVESTTEITSESTDVTEPTTESEMESSSSHNKMPIMIVITRGQDTADEMSTDSRLDSPTNRKAMTVQIPGLPDIRMVVRTDIQDSQIKMKGTGLNVV